MLESAFNHHQFGNAGSPLPGMEGGRAHQTISPKASLKSTDRVVSPE
jgi:hypothetical protein